MGWMDGNLALVCMACQRRIMCSAIYESIFVIRGGYLHLAALGPWTNTRQCCDVQCNYRGAGRIKKMEIPH
jgi:hypothetical protein